MGPYGGLSLRGGQQAALPLIGTWNLAQLLPQFWRAGEVGSIRTMAGLLNSMTEFDNRRTVTVSSPQPFGYQQNGTIHASGPLWNEME